FTWQESCRGLDSALTRGSHLAMLLPRGTPQVGPGVRVRPAKLAQGRQGLQGYLTSAWAELRASGRLSSLWCHPTKRILIRSHAVKRAAQSCSVQRETRPSRVELAHA